MSPMISVEMDYLVRLVVVESSYDIDGPLFEMDFEVRFHVL